MNVHVKQYGQRGCILEARGYIKELTDLMHNEIQ